MWRKVSQPESPALAGGAVGKLEEKLEFSNVTQFRNSVLDVVPKLQENPSLRLVITKHGEPAAVIMSYEAYGALKRIAERMIAEDDAKDPVVALHDAYERMTNTRVQPALEMDQVAEQLEVLARQVKALGNAIAQQSEEAAGASEEASSGEQATAT